MVFAVADDFLRRHRADARECFELFRAGGIDRDEPAPPCICLLRIKRDMDLHPVRKRLRHIDIFHGSIRQHISRGLHRVEEAAPFGKLIDPRLPHGTRHIDEKRPRRLLTGKLDHRKRLLFRLPCGMPQKKGRSQSQKSRRKTDHKDPSAFLFSSHGNGLLYASFKTGISLIPFPKRGMRNKE